MAYQRFVVNGKKMAKKKKSKRSTKASRSAAAKKAARTRKSKKLARSRAAKKAAKTRARGTKKRPKKRAKKKRNPAGLAAPAKSVPQYKKRKRKGAAKGKDVGKGFLIMSAMRKHGISKTKARALYEAGRLTKTGEIRAASAFKAVGTKAKGPTKQKPRRKRAAVVSARAPVVSPRTPEAWRRAQATAFAQMKAAEDKCDAAYKKLAKKQAVTKAELDKTKALLKKAESAIKAFERTIGRLEAPAKAQAKKTLSRLKARQRDTARRVKRTVQYYNTKNKKGQPVKRVRKGGKTWVKSKTRAKRCPPSKASVKRSARAVRKGESSGKALADKRWCGGVKTSEVKRNFWALGEKLI
jgi:hypothetical protein